MVAYKVVTKCICCQTMSIKNVFGVQISCKIAFQFPRTFQNILLPVISCLQQTTFIIHTMIVRYCYVAILVSIQDYN